MRRPTWPQSGDQEAEKLMKRASLLAVVLLTLVSAARGADVAAAFPSDDEIRALLRQRIDEQHQGVGIVVGVLDRAGSRVIPWGTFDRGTKKVAADTVFEIGS